MLIQMLLNHPKKTLTLLILILTTPMNAHHGIMTALILLTTPSTHLMTLLVSAATTMIMATMATTTLTQKSHTMETYMDITVRLRDMLKFLRFNLHQNLPMSEYQTKSHTRRRLL